MSEEYVGCVSDFIYQAPGFIDFNLADENGDPVYSSPLGGGLRVQPISFMANVILGSRTDGVKVKVNVNGNRVTSVSIIES